MASSFGFGWRTSTGTPARSIRISKTGKPRHIVLTDEGAAFFVELCARRGGTEPMLLKAHGGTWRKSHQLRPMLEACRRGKIDPPINFHVLRHTWASLATMNGVPLLIVAKNLGHTDTRMVEKHYGHLAPSYISEAIRAGAPRFGNVKPRALTRTAVAQERRWARTSSTEYS